MRNQRLLNARLAINKEHGERTIMHAAQVLRAPCISTGSIAFDRALGGGVPIGKASLFYGPEMSGKTSSAYRIAGYGQKLCANCYREVKNIEVIGSGDKIEVKGHCDCYSKGLFHPVQEPNEKHDEYKQRLAGYDINSYADFVVAIIDLEGAFDPIWARKLGLDARRCFYTRPDTAEETIDIYEDLIRTAAVDLIIIDSLASMVPATEVMSHAIDQQQGLQARVLGKWNRKIQVASNSVLSKYKKTPTQIWINQMREKIGVAYGDNRVLPGGKSQLFFSSIRVSFWASQYNKEAMDTDLIKELQSEVANQVSINFKVEKNRFAPPMHKSSYILNLDGPNAGQIDEQKYVLAMAYKLGFMRDDGEGAKKRWFIAEEEYKTKKEMLERMNEPEVYAHLREAILDRLLGAA